jgi:hypothetical protein
MTGVANFPPAPWFQTDPAGGGGVISRVAFPQNKTCWQKKTKFPPFELVRRRTKKIRSFYTYNVDECKNEIKDKNRKKIAERVH